VTSFSRAMLGLMAVVLFLVALGEIRSGRLGAAIALAALGFVLSGMAAAL
jgi:hypothetical protein